jgi:hypothetical protein
VLANPKKSPLNPPFIKGGKFIGIYRNHPPFLKGERGGFCNQI